MRRRQLAGQSQVNLLLSHTLCPAKLMECIVLSFIFYRLGLEKKKNIPNHFGHVNRTGISDSLHIQHLSYES